MIPEINSKFYKIRAVIPSSLWDEIRAHNDIQKIDRIITEMFCQRYGIEY
jgi:hypothetical protein